LFGCNFFLAFFFRREIKQKNEGGWEFFWDEESKPGYVILEVKVAKYLDSSLIDVDVHPSYVSVVIKSKVAMC
jgi:protein TilB